MSDARTLAVYNSQTDAYEAMMAAEAASDRVLRSFIDTVPPGGRVLDLGCGPGTHARVMAEAGLAVEAIDASRAMAARANRIPGVAARLGRFEDVAGEARYDGVWASFSLLHAPRRALPVHLARIARALRSGAPLFVGMKTGQGEGRDRLGRFYVFYTPSELEARLCEAGLAPCEAWTGMGRGLDGTESEWVVMRADA